MDRRSWLRYCFAMIRSIARPIAWLLLTTILFVTLSPIAMRPVTAEPANLERFAAFAAVGFVFVIGCPRHWAWVTCLVIGSALAFEAAQLLAPSRHAHFEDAAAKAIGGIVGILAGAAINGFAARRRSASH